MGGQVLMSEGKTCPLRTSFTNYVHRSSIIAQAQPSGQLPSTDQLNISIALPLRNTMDLDQLLRDLYDPTSPRFHQYLTSEQFAQQFGPSEQDYDIILAFAKAHGFEITATHPNRTLVTLKGQVADIEKIFHLRFQLYQHPLEERLFYAPEAEPWTDQHLPILRVNGLDDFYVRRTPLHAIMQSSSGSVGPAIGSGPGGTLISRDLRNAYAPGVTLTGLGQAVGIYNPPHGFNPNDIITYQTVTGIAPLVPVNKVLIDGNDSPLEGSTKEVILDIEMAIAMAPGLSQVLVYQGADYVSTLNRMATDNIAKQLTSSWPTPPENSSADQVYKQFAVQGQTFFCASGDAGAYYPTQPFSADDPFITVVSGTQLILSNDGAWESEVVWHNDFGSGGGGTMNRYPLPDWQKNIDMSVNLGSTQSRNSPDVAMVADNLFMVLNSQFTGGGGTSAASPLWAGYMALINERAALAGKQPLGFLNPSLYALGKSSSYTKYFHDITFGNNLTPWNTQPNNANQYIAKPGYDLCTGWGTPTGIALINALVGVGEPTLRIRGSVKTSCLGGWVEHSAVTFSPEIHGISDLIQPLSYQWNLPSGGTPTSSLTGTYLSVVMPDAGNEVVVTLTVTDATGYQVFALIKDETITADAANNRSIACALIGRIRNEGIINWPLPNPFGPDPGPDPITRVTRQTLLRLRETASELVKSIGHLLESEKESL